MVRKMFKFVVFLLLELALVNQKKLKADIFTLGNTFPQILNITPHPPGSRGKLLITPGNIFSNFSPPPQPSRKEGENL